MRDTAEPNSAIKSAEFLDDNTVKVTYFSEDDEEITKKIKLQNKLKTESFNIQMYL